MKDSVKTAVKTVTTDIAGPLVVLYGRYVTLCEVLVYSSVCSSSNWQFGSNTAKYYLPRSVRLYWAIYAVIAVPVGTLSHV